jgi:hypothetical protein
VRELLIETIRKGFTAQPALEPLEMTKATILALLSACDFHQLSQLQRFVKIGHIISDAFDEMMRRQHSNVADVQRAQAGFWPNLHDELVALTAQVAATTGKPQQQVVGIKQLKNYLSLFRLCQRQPAILRFPFTLSMMLRDGEKILRLMDSDAEVKAMITSV